MVVHCSDGPVSVDGVFAGLVRVFILEYVAGSDGCCRLVPSFRYKWRNLFGVACRSAT